MTDYLALVYSETTTNLSSLHRLITVIEVRRPLGLVKFL